MSSVTKTSRKILPWWTWKYFPTNSGGSWEFLSQFLSWFSWVPKPAATFFIRLASMYGPFLADLAMFSKSPSLNYQFIRILSSLSGLTYRRLAPGSLLVFKSDMASAFSSSVRVGVRMHGNSSDGRPSAHSSSPARCSQPFGFELNSTQLSDCGQTSGDKSSNFSRRQLDQNPLFFFTLKNAGCTYSLYHF